MDISGWPIFGSESSVIEYEQLALLTLLLCYTSMEIHGIRHPYGGALLFPIALWSILFLGIGREFSYGKHVGVPHEIRTVARLLSFIGVLGLLTLTVRASYTTVLDTLKLGFGPMREQKWLVTAIILLFVISQVVDKDFLYIIHPPPLAQAIEETAEMVSYVFGGVFIHRHFSSAKAA